MCSTQTSVKTGQHEPVTFDQTTPPSSQSQSDLLEGSGEEAVTPLVWQQLRHQNTLLTQQLQEREVERNRLREQLEVHLQRQERLQRHSPHGLPSRVLDGRPVIRKETQGGRDLKAGSPARAEELLGLQNQIDQLSQERDTLRHSLEGDKMALQAELERQREAISKLKERKDDLTQNVAVLTYENSHQNGTITMLQEDNYMLHASLETSMRQVRSLEESYAAVRRENTELRGEVQRLTCDRHILTKEKDQLRKNILLGGGGGGGGGGDVKVDTKQELAERAELREKLARTEQEVKALHEQLDRKRSGEEGRGRAFAELSAKLGQVSDELQSTRKLVAGMKEQQRVALRESFTALVQRFGERSKSGAQTNVSQLRAMLQMSNDTVKQLKKEVDHLTCENALMISQKAGLLGEVQKLKSLVVDLKGQRETLEAQVAKGKSLLEEKERVVECLRGEQLASQGALSAKEQEWRDQLTREGEEWRVRVEKVEEEKEVALREQEMLSLQKEGLEGQVTHLKATNEQLTLHKEQLMQSVHNLEAKMADLVTTVAEKDGEIALMQRTIADLRAERSRLLAQLEEAESEVRRGAGLRAELDQTLQSTQSEVLELKDTLASFQASADKLQTQLLEQSAQIEELSNKAVALGDEKVKLCVEREDLQKRLTASLEALQEAKEAGLVGASEGERVQRELRGRVTSLEEEKRLLEERLAEAERTEASAFQKVPETKLLEQLRLKLSSLQQESRQGRKGAAEVKELLQRLSEAEGRTRVLEGENQQLKKSVLTKDAAEPLPSSSSLTSLHRQMAEVKMKLMFAEQERDDMAEKVHKLLASQKVSSNKDTARLQEVQEENTTLLNKVRFTEERCKREMVVMGDRLKRAARENDQLRHRLTTLVSSVNGSGDHSIEKAGEELKAEVRTLEMLKVSLSTARVDLSRHLERNQQQMVALERDLQGIIGPHGGREVSSQHARRTTSAGGTALRPVLQNLPPGVLSSFEGAVTPPRYPTPTPVDQSSSATELHPKMAELRAHQSTLAAEIQGKLATFQRGEEEVEALRGRVVTLTSALQKAGSREREVHEVVAKVKDLDLPPGQLQQVQLLEKKVATLEDQVYDRDAALQEINQQMKEDYKMYNQKFTSLMSQIKDLREQLASCTRGLKSKDKFIQELQGRFAALEGELRATKKELEQLGQERDQLVSHCVMEDTKVSGLLGVKEYLRTQKEELARAQKAIGDFRYDLRQIQSQLETVQREKSGVELRSVEEERMHIHMKEALNNEIAHLRHLNLVLVEQQLKGVEDEKVKQLMIVVKETQEAQRKHKEVVDLESQLDAAKVSLREEQNKNVQLMEKVYNQEFLIRCYETDKGSGRFVGSGRPRSAEVPRKGFRITQTRQPPFPHLPEQNHFVVGVGDELVDLQNESKTVLERYSLGPPVETDDEASCPTSLTGDVATPFPTRSAFKPRHRRTHSASEFVTMGTLGFSGTKQWLPCRPDSTESAISTPAIPDTITSVAHDVSQQVTALSQAIEAPESSSQKEGSDSSSKSCSLDVTATLKQSQPNIRGHAGGLFKMMPTTRAAEHSTDPKVLRTDSMSSSNSTAGVSRDTSFSRYDGSESSPQSLSHESLGVTNHLLAPSAMGFKTISESSSEDDIRTSGRRWDSETPHVKESSVSSCDSDVYHTQHQRQVSQPNPVHRVDSICVSEMSYTTDVELFDKVEELGKQLGKVKYSSTGSVKVCYGEESSNTSMEDVRLKK